jgi:hypothetical protein
MKSRGLLLTALAAALLAAPAAQAAPNVPALPGSSQLREDQAQFLKIAEDGVARAKELWWNEKLGWYNELLEPDWRPPLMMLWSGYQMFNAVNAIALADPSKANEQAVRDFANGAEKYWNPRVKPVGAYAYYQNFTDPNIHYYFDDNGWWGIAFLDAYRITHDARYVKDAKKAFRFLDVAGWDAAGGGGFWWETKHLHKTSEPLAAAVLIGARLYEITHDRTYLAKARTWLAWANVHSWNKARGLYARSDTDDTVMSYVEGLMAAANAELCKITKKQGYCARAELVAQNSLPAFGVDLNWSPRYDAVALYGLLNLYSLDRNPSWYALAYHNAQRALANAPDDKGLFLNDWDGSPRTVDDQLQGQIGSHAATLSVFAWLAASPLPRS